MRSNQAYLRGGFTLLEALVVATIFSIIVAGLAGSFAAGMKVWKKAKDMGGSDCDFIIAFEKFSQELKESVYMPSVGFAGSAQEVSFCGIPNDHPVKITYTFSKDEKALMCRQTDVQDEKSYTEKKVLLLEGFSLRYFYFDEEQDEYSWTESWSEEQGVFTAIEIKGVYNGKELIKTVFIPIS